MKLLTLMDEAAEREHARQDLAFRRTREEADRERIKGRAHGHDWADSMKSRT